MNKYICVRELILCLFRDVSLGRLCSNSLVQVQQQPQETSPQHPGVVRLHVNAFYFSTMAKRVTSPNWGPPPLCKQALTRSTLLHKKWKVVVRSSRLLAEFVVTTLEIECVKRKLFLYFHAPRISQVISRLSNLPVLKMRWTLFCAERTYVGPSIV